MNKLLHAYECIGIGIDSNLKKVVEDYEGAVRFLIRDLIGKGLATECTAGGSVRAGSIFFRDSYFGGNHIGIVISVEKDGFYTIEGN